MLIWEAVKPPDIPYPEATKCLTDIPLDKGRVFVYYSADAGRTPGAYAKYSAGLMLGGGTGLGGPSESISFYIDDGGMGVVRSEEFSFVDLTVGKHTFHTTPYLEDGKNNKTLEIKESGQPYFVKITIDENFEVVAQMEAEKELAEYVYPTLMGTPPCLKK